MNGPSPARLARPGDGPGFGLGPVVDSGPGSTVRPTNTHRLPTVDDVLPFSPLASIAPFPTAIVPFPELPRAFRCPPLPDVSARQAGIELLSSLDSASSDPSLQHHNILADLRSIFAGSQPPRYMFKQPVAASVSESPMPPPRSSRLVGISSLSRFASDVLVAADAKYGYPSPISVPGSGSKKQHGSIQSAQPSPSPIPARTANHATTRLEIRPPAATPAERSSETRQLSQTPKPTDQTAFSTPTPKANPPAGWSDPRATPRSGPNPSPSVYNNSKPSGFAIVIERSPATRLDNYAPLQPTPHNDFSSLSRKLDPDEVAAQYSSIQVDSDAKAKGQTAFNQLQSLLEDILEAEDSLQPDTSGLTSHQAGSYFVPDTGCGSTPLRLLPEVFTRLDSAIQSTITHKRFFDVPADNLVRIQKMAEGSIAGVESLSLFVSDEMTVTEADEWTGQVGLAIEGLQASRLVLRMMCSGREEKMLYSEDLVRVILAGLRQCVDMVVVPIVEMRGSEASTAFSTLSHFRKLLADLLVYTGRVLRLVGDLIISVDLAETVISAVEDLSLRLIFVENAHFEKDSVVGIQRFETLRRVSMDVLAKIFKRYPHLRNSILDEILTSLEKLPVQRQSARQFRLPEGRPVQLVSALLIRLVQMAATLTDTAGQTPKRSKDRVSDSEETDESEEEEDDDDDTKQVARRKKTNVIALSMFDRFTVKVAMKELKSLSSPLYASAQQAAQYIVTFLVHRALNATKSGDTPYRNLLDIFTEDFLAVLGSADWPGSEILLRSLLSQMIGLIESDKSTLGAKTMALDLMGTMGSGISDLQHFVRQTYHGLDGQRATLSSRLVGIAEDLLEDNPLDLESLGFEGPPRVMLEYLYARDISQDGQIPSAIGYLLAQWAKQIVALYEAPDADSQADTFPRLKRLALLVRNMIVDYDWLHHEYEFEQASTVQGRLSSALVCMNLPFCRAMKRIFSTLLMMLNSEHASLKSRSLKSVVLLLEKDPSILNRSNIVISHIIRLMGDSSTMVRDSALGLLSKCLSLKPSLENDVVERLIARASDASVMVRKRALKILKDIYLRNEKQEIRAAIADAMLHRARDLDENVAEIAKQTFEEIWMSPFFRSAGFKDRDDELANGIALQKQVALVVRTVQRGESVLPVLDSLLHGLLSAECKHSEMNFAVCKQMVRMMFDLIIDNNDQPGALSQVHMLQTLTVFAKASPTLFSAQQLELLEPYVKNLSNADDLLIYRSVIIIFRHVLPSLSSLQHSFLKSIQDSLLATVSKLGKSELSEVASCLWIIDTVLKNTDRLIRLNVSVLNGIQNLKSNDLSDPSQAQALNRLRRYILIAGHFGKACNFDSHLSEFRKKFPTWKGSSVSSLFVDLIIPFTRQSQPSGLREVAFECIGMICQSWPAQFLRPDVGTAFELAFHNDDARLENIVMACFRSFFAAEEKLSETGAVIPVGEGAVNGSARLDKSLAATETDGVSTCIAQKFLSHILLVSVGRPDETAVLATHIIASVNRQGLVHPKECGTALVALSTSSNATISTIAFQELSGLNYKHESMFEKEYMKAVRQTFVYHNTQLQSPVGFTGQPHVAKLRPFFEVLKNGNAKIRKRFLTNIVSRTNLELGKVQLDRVGVENVAFIRFVVENIGLFEYSRVDELLHLIGLLEKTVTSSGAAVAHVIEVEILGVRLGDPVTKPTTPPVELGVVTVNIAHSVKPESAMPEIRLDRLRSLTVAASVMMMVWGVRTHLRKLYNQARPKVTAGNPKTATKELSKAPVRTAGVTHDKFLERTAELGLIATTASISSSGLMMPAINDGGLAVGEPKDGRPVFVETCQEFAELLAIDSEHRAEEGRSDEGDNGYDSTGPAGLDEADDGPGGAQARQKRRRHPGLSTPSKKQRRR